MNNFKIVTTINSVIKFVKRVGKIGTKTVIEDFIVKNLEYIKLQHSLDRF
jgi:hypothetical protein